MAQTTASFATCRHMRHAIKSDYGNRIMGDMTALQFLSNQQSINQNWVFHATACLHHDDTAVFNPNETQYCWHRTFPSHQLILCWLVVAFARLWRASRSCNRCNCTHQQETKSMGTLFTGQHHRKFFVARCPSPPKYSKWYEEEFKEVGQWAKVWLGCFRWQPGTAGCHFVDNFKLHDVFTRWKANPIPLPQRIG